MSQQYTIKSASTALAASTARTLAHVATSANVPLRIKEWWIEMDGTDASKAPVLVEIVRFSGTAPTGTATTPTNKNADVGNHSTVTGKTNCTVEPATPGDVLYRHYVSPTSGKHVLFPLGDEILTTAGADQIGVRVTTAAGVTPDAVAGFAWDE